MHERIRKLRKTLDLTQEKFAERIGIKRNTIATYESGRNEPVDSVVALICREFHVNEEWLRYGTGEMFTKDSEDELKALTEKYSLTSADRVLIEKYVSLNADTRKAILKFMTDVVSSLEEADRYSDIPYTPEELEQNFLQSEDENKKRGRG
jgi:toxin-antitoxin system, antitoxin component, xre family